jgi:NhaP-type Na+/H+ or K+/H+ antiporter
LAHCSGIIAVFGYGVTVKAFGETLYNDSHLFRHFWEITEFLLDSLLFALAGCVWAFVIENENTRWMDVVSGFASILLFQPSDRISTSSWCVLSQGYLFVLFVLLNVIRFFLIFTSFPLISRIEIGTNWQEACFMSYGGLRGAVAISLALSLNVKVGEY